MILSFKSKHTERLYHGDHISGFRGLPQDILSVARRKLDMIQAAHRLEDLKTPPGNRLEALRGDMNGYYSIRVNDQWRIVFKWENGNARDVWLTDYH